MSHTSPHRHPVKSIYSATTSPAVAKRNALQQYLVAASANAAASTVLKATVVAAAALTSVRLARGSRAAVRQVLLALLLAVAIAPALTVVVPVTGMVAASPGPIDEPVQDAQIAARPVDSPVQALQSPPAKFEAVSIRRCADDKPPVGANGGARSGQGGFPTISPGRFTIDCGTVERLISNAYVLNGERLANNDARIGDVSWWKGGPEWIRYDKFTIEASAPGVTDRAVLLGPMLRALLEDRFKLKLHRETQDGPIYAMTVAKGGLKIQPMPPDGCTPVDQVDFSDPRAQAAAVNAGTAKPTCGGMTMMGGPGHARWTIGATTLPDFAHTLSAAMDHYVVDRTGAGPDTKFNIHLEFAPDEHVPGADKRNPRSEFAPPDAPTIFAALEQQLGLKLEATKGPQTVLVIDHIERPTPDGPIATPSRQRQTMEGVAHWLSGMMDRHVLDQTGVSDTFVIYLEYAPDGQVPYDFRIPGVSDPPTAPSITQVLKSLGPELQPTKGTKGYIVIDHAERPSMDAYATSGPRAPRP
jgi:uncharacterized protein (TIGR03435 family)